MRLNKNISFCFSHVLFQRNRRGTIRLCFRARYLVHRREGPVALAGDVVSGGQRAAEEQRTVGSVQRRGVIGGSAVPSS